MRWPSRSCGVSLTGPPHGWVWRTSEHECSAVTDADGYDLRPGAEAARTPALPPRADARAPVSLQPGLRRLRQDPVPRPHPQEELERRGLPGRGRGVRRADGLDPRGRAAHV